MAKSKNKRLRKLRRYSGQFVCHCGNKWTSNDLSIQECEQCTSCGQFVDPSKVELTSEVETKDFIANYEERYFGQFQCFKCLRTWFSAHAWLGFGQQCRKCFIWTSAHRLSQLYKPRGMDKKNDQKKPHEMDLCGKCQALGFSCKVNRLINSLSRLNIR